jgi:formate dehydrogenase subunit gamma
MTERLLGDILQRHAGTRGALLPVLHEVQEAFGCIAPDLVPRIAGALNLSRAEVHGVITFFHDFRSEPGGCRRLAVCRAEACQAVGARALQAEAERLLGVPTGGTTADGAWTLDAVYCLGNCACGPSVRIGEAVYGRVDAERLAALIAGDDGSAADSPRGSAPCARSPGAAP